VPEPGDDEVTPDLGLGSKTL